MTRIGFTGTRQGMTSDQELMLRNIVGELLSFPTEPFEFHHGMCEGSDQQAHESMVREYGDQVSIVGYPGVNAQGQPATRGKFDLDEFTEIFPDRPYLVRDKIIVRAVHYLIATPHTDHEVRRSGTWATIRKARDRRIPRYVIFPSGEVWDDEPF